MRVLAEFSSWKHVQICYSDCLVWRLFWFWKKSYNSWKTLVFWI